MKIYVDADSCPVIEEVIAVAHRYQLSSCVVANQELKKMKDRKGVELLVVGETFSAVDEKIIELIKQDDILLTGDIELAERGLDAGASVMDFKGQEFDTARVREAKALRDLHQQIREHQDLTGSGKKKTKKEREQLKSAFKGLFHNWLEKKMRTKKESPTG